MEKRKKTLLFAGYGAAIAGFLLYFFTRDAVGMMMGGLFLFITSFYKILSDWKKKR